MTDPVIIGRAQLYLGDCREVMPSLGLVDCVVTSPPYGDMRDYNNRGDTDNLAVIGLCAERLSAGSVMMWNVADQTINGSESGDSFRQALHAMECGLRLHDTMIYCKDFVSFPDSNRYLPAFEYMFCFSKGAPRHFNGIRDWVNKWRGSPMHGTDRQKDGSTKQISGVGRPVAANGLRRNWWPISNAYTGDTKGHPAPMPLSMALDHIETWTAPGETVLDPYLGSGTTGIAAAKLGRPFIGIERDPEYFAIAKRRITEAQRQGDMFVEAAA